MKTNIKLIDLSVLKQHERTNRKHVLELIEQIESDGHVKDPIIVDKNTMIILDGHHRFNALKWLGLKRVPVFLCQL